MQKVVEFSSRIGNDFEQLSYRVQQSIDVGNEPVGCVIQNNDKTTWDHLRQPLVTKKSVMMRCYEVLPNDLADGQWFIGNTVFINEDDIIIVDDKGFVLRNDTEGERHYIPCDKDGKKCSIEEATELLSVALDEMTTTKQKTDN